MVVCLFVWFVGLLVCWMNGWIDGWMDGCLLAWLVVLSVCLVGWLVLCLVKHTWLFNVKCFHRKPHDDRTQ